jgi:hypothetical protein
MAQITWRDVTAPDFSSAMTGYQNFSKMLGNSFSGLKSAVGGFDNAKSDMVNKQLQLALAQTDAAGLKQAVQAGQLGGMTFNDPSFLRRVSQTNLDALGPTAVDARDRAEMSLRQAHTTDTHQVAWDGAAGQLALIDAATRNNDRGTAEQIASGLNYADLGAGNASKVDEMLRGGARTQVADDKARVGFTNEQTDRADQTAVDAAVSDVRAKAASTDDVRLMLSDPKGPAANLSPRARASLEAQLAGAYPDLFAPITGASAAIAGALGGGGGAAPVAGVAGGAASDPWNIVIGGSQMGLQPDKPITDMTLAEAEAYGKNVLIPRTKGNAKLGLPADKGSSAMGAFQILSASTLGEYAKKLNLDMNTTKFTPQVQDKIAEQIFNDSKGGNLQSVWTSLKDARPGAYANKSWAEVRGEIAKGESSASTSQLALDSIDTQRGMAARNMQDSRHGLNIDFATTMADNRDVTKVADELRAGPLVGTHRGFVLTQLNKIMREGKVNAATAGAVLTRNVVGSDEGSGFGRIFSPEKFMRQIRGGTPNLGGDARLNDKGVAEDIAKLAQMKDGDFLGQMRARDDRTMAAGSLAAAQAQLQAADAAYRAASMRAVSQPGLRENLPRYKAQLDAAKQAVMLLTQAGQTAQNQPG